jgi:ankyrin repeat protein
MKLLYPSMFQGGETALHHAAASGSLDTVKLLHSRGAKLDAADRVC